MDRLDSLLQGTSKQQCLSIVAFVGNDKKRFAALMERMIKGDKKVRVRTAWPVSYCVEAHPALFSPYFSKVIPLINDLDAPPAVRRNIIRLLQYVSIPARYQGRIMDACFSYIADPVEKPAVKAFALTVLENLARSYPDIRQELIYIIKERWDTETPAFRSRARKILAKG